MHVDMHQEKSPVTCAHFGRKSALSALGSRLDGKPWCPSEVMCLVLVLDRPSYQADEKSTVVLGTMETDSIASHASLGSLTLSSFCTQSALIYAFSK